MLKNMLLELNARCGDYGMNINISKTKAMVIGRNPKKIDMRIKDESVEQVDSFKYLGQHELLSGSEAGNTNGKRSF